MDLLIPLAVQVTAVPLDGIDVWLSGRYFAGSCMMMYDWGGGGEGGGGVSFEKTILPTLPNHFPFFFYIG